MVAVGHAYTDPLQAAAAARMHRGEVRIHGTLEVVMTTYGTVRPGREVLVRTPCSIGQQLRHADKPATIAQPAPQLRPRVLAQPVETYRTKGTIQSWRAN